MLLPTACKPLVITADVLLELVTQLRRQPDPRPVQVRTVALVGNGPTSPPQRDLISSMDVVVRFNVPKGFAPGAGERMTVWVVRHAAAATRRGYWGPEQLEDAVSERLIEFAEVRACNSYLARSAVMHRTQMLRLTRRRMFPMPVQVTDR